jgi:hypothetical protein
LIKPPQTLESIFSANFLFGSTIPHSMKAITIYIYNRQSLTELTMTSARAEEWRKLTNQPSGVIPNQWNQPQKIE